MPIEFTCECGQRYRVKDSYAGRAIQCRGCRADIEVPPADAVDLGIVTEKPYADEPVANMPLADVRAADAVAGATVSLSPARPRTRSTYPQPPAVQRVVVIDFDMPFSSLVWLLIKLVLAATLATAFVWAIIAAVVMTIALVLSSLGLAGGRFL